MLTRVRRFLSASFVVVVLASVAMPAYSCTQSMTGGMRPVSATLDVMLLRPIGFTILVVSTALFITRVPFILITRPHEIGTPFRSMVIEPAKYVWVDPLGCH